MLHLPLKIVQRLDMPEAFAGDGAEGQGAEEIHKKDFRDYRTSVPFERLSVTHGCTSCGRWSGCSRSGLPHPLP